MKTRIESNRPFGKLHSFVTESLPHDASAEEIAQGIETARFAHYQQMAKAGKESDRSIATGYALDCLLDTQALKDIERVRPLGGIESINGTLQATGLPAIYLASALELLHQAWMCGWDLSGEPTGFVILKMPALPEQPVNNL